MGVDPRLPAQAAQGAQASPMSPLFRMTHLSFKGLLDRLLELVGPLCIFTSPPIPSDNGCF